MSTQLYKVYFYTWDEKTMENKLIREVNLTFVPQIGSTIFIQNDVGLVEQVLYYMDSHCFKVHLAWA